MTALTLITIAVMVLAARSRRGYWVALAVGGATPIGAVLIVGDTAVPTFYAAAVGALIGLVVRVLSRTHRRTSEPGRFPGAVALIAFTVWAIVVTLTAPLFFFGSLVFLGPDPESISTIGAVPTTSNIAQIGYLILSVSVVFFLAKSRGVGPQVVGVAATLLTLLSFWRYLSINAGLPFPEGFFDNNTTFRFIETLPGGAPRFRGILSEPASLALSSIVTISYSLSRAAQVRGLHRVGVLITAAMAAIMAAVSTSATFVVVCVILAAMAAFTTAYHLLVNGGRVRALALVAASGAAIAAIWLVPLAVDAVATAVGEKVGTSSFDDRTLADARSVALVIENFGFGVGIGSNRSSSFVPLLLSTTGVIGLLLFVATVVALMRSTIHLREYRPVLWALAAVLVSKVVSAPDLSDSSGVLWLSLGVLASAARRARYGPLDPSAGGGTVPTPRSARARYPAPRDSVARGPRAPATPEIDTRTTPVRVIRPEPRRPSR